MLIELVARVTAMKIVAAKGLILQAVEIDRNDIYIEIYLENKYKSSIAPCYSRV